MTTSPVARAKSALRRNKPAFVVPYIVRERTKKMLADPRAMELAREQMEFVLGVARPDADLEAAAERYVFRMVERSESRWHSKLITHQKIEGIEHLVDRDPTRGVVLSFMHHGEYSGAVASLGRVGADVHVVVDAGSLRPDTPEFMKQHVRVGSIFAEVVSTDEGSAGFTARLEAGQILGIATDVRGSSEVTFLGRRLMGSSGAARLAEKTNSQIVVMTSHPGEDGKPFVRLSPPLEPAEFGDPVEILNALLAVHEPAVVGWPEMYDFPTTRWRSLGEGG